MDCMQEPVVWSPDGWWFQVSNWYLCYISTTCYIRENVFCPFKNEKSKYVFKYQIVDMLSENRNQTKKLNNEIWNQIKMSSNILNVLNCYEMESVSWDNNIKHYFLEVCFFCTIFINSVQISHLFGVWVRRNGIQK